ncbi:MAG: hypothetical protein ACW99Q_19610 [Candidatus Kariarchaeaceae archaeon]
MMNLKDLATVVEQPLKIEKKDGIWYVRIGFLEIIKGGLLVSAYGRGTTKALAIHDYVTDIQGKRVVVDAMKVTRREFRLPTIMSKTLR